MGHLFVETCQLERDPESNGSVRNQVENIITDSLPVLACESFMQTTAC